MSSLKELLNRIPEQHSGRKAAEKCVAAAERFQAKAAAIKSSQHLTESGKREAVRTAMADYVREHAAANEAVQKTVKAASARRSELAPKPLDKSETATAIDHMERRNFIRSLDPLKRAAYLTSTEDVETLRAALLSAPEISGVADPDLAAKVEEHYTRVVHGSVLDEIEAAESAAAEAAMVAKVARDEIQRAAGMTAQEFEGIAGPIENKVGAPWLIRDGARVLVCEVDDNGMASYAPASEWQVANGVEYKNAAEWRASRAAA
jgi:hypothetical protein